VTYVRGDKSSGIGNATLNLFVYVGLAAKALPINMAPKMKEGLRKNLAIFAEWREKGVQEQCWISRLEL